MVCSHSDGYVKRDEKKPLEIVALLVLQEAPNSDNRQYQHDNVEDLKLEIHLLAQTPGHDDGQRPVEQGGLQGGAQDVGEGKVHLVVPGLVDGGQVLGELLDEGDEDEADEGVGDVGDLDDVVDLQDEDDGDDGDEGDADGEGEKALGHGELGLVPVLFLVRVALLIVGEDGVVDALVGAGLEDNEDDVGDHEEDGEDAGHVETLELEVFRREVILGQAEPKGSRHGQGNASREQ